MINLNKWARPIPRQDTYAINVDRKRNCYNYSGFGHITRNCEKRKEA